VKLTRRLPRWWRCDLARLAGVLDDRWGTEAIAEDGRPA
jgi:hypothetical protein